MGSVLWLWGGRQAISWKRLSLLGATHGLLAAAIMKIPAITAILKWLGHGLNSLNASVVKGTSFVFGYLGGAPLPFTATGSPFILMFQTLPTIVVTSALTMALFHLGIIPRIIQLLSHSLTRVTKIGGALSAGLVSKIFLGQTEVPLVIRPYIPLMSAHEIIVLMIAGMSTSAWATFAPYSQILASIIPPEISMVHLLGGTLLNIVAAMMVGELLFPSHGESTPGDCTQPTHHTSLVQAVSHGAQEGWRVMMLVAAVMIAFMALIDVCNNVLSWSFSWTGMSISLTNSLSSALTPLLWLVQNGTWAESKALATLLSHKILINEWVAFQHLANDTTHSPHVQNMAIYVLGSFGNIGSMGIQMACFGAFDPHRSQWLGANAPKAFVGSMVATLYTTMIVDCYSRLPPPDPADWVAEPWLD